MLWTKILGSAFWSSLRSLLELLSPLLLARLHRGLLSLTAKHMRRVITADKVAVGFAYFEGDTEVGHLHYSLTEGKFSVQVFPKDWSVFQKIGEYYKILRLAANIIKSEYV